MVIKPSGSFSRFDVFRLGQKYMKTWPSDKKLSIIFPENRVTCITRFGIRYMPPFTILILSWQMIFGGQWATAITTALFACTLPLQGLWWLGKRAITPLPPSLLKWFHEMRNKLIAAGHTMDPLEQRPSYQSLAELLKCVFKKLDKTFLDDL